METSEPSTLARNLFNRIGHLERSRCQAQFLQLLQTTPLREKLVLRGASSLHGIWLHGRCSKDLDFLAPPEIANDFVEVAGRNGITLEHSVAGKLPSFYASGDVFKRIAIGVDVFSRPIEVTTYTLAQWKVFNLPSQEVRALPFVDQVAEKMRSTCRRGKPTDFFDVWLSFKKFPEILIDIQEVLNRGEVQGEEIRFNAHIAMFRFNQCEAMWDEHLLPLLNKVPGYQVVKEDLIKVFDQLSYI